MRKSVAVPSVAVCLVATLAGCHSKRPEDQGGAARMSVVGPTAPTAATSATAASTPTGNAMRGVTLPIASPSDVLFPPRNEPYDFRVDLESKYRDGLRRSPVSSYVDIEGDIVWVQEYLRYRLNACSHLEAVDRVLGQVQGGGIAPVCGASSSGTVLFPPRNEPFDFRQRLEATYRDVLRRSTSSTYVDIEGDIVWVQEYLRYRVNGCGHAEATQRVFAQIDGRGIQPVCQVATTSSTTTSTVVPSASLRADPGGPYGPVNSGSPVTFSGLGSTSSPNRIAHYYWTCGQSGNGACQADNPTPTFRYNKEVASVGSTRTYTVTLTIEDTAGNRASATTTVRVSQVY